MISALRRMPLPLLFGLAAPVVWGLYWLIVLRLFYLMVPVTRAIANTCGEASVAFERGAELPTAKLVS
jgi:hypothetical protein